MNQLSARHAQSHTYAHFLAQIMSRPSSHSVRVSHLKHHDSRLCLLSHNRPAFIASIRDQAALCTSPRCHLKMSDLTPDERWLYPALDTSGREIRLLSYEHFGYSWDLSSRVYKLGEHPPYVALSYRWGDAHPGYTLNINGQIVRTTPNLFKACRQLEKHFRLDQQDGDAPKGPWSHVWIDALCINQQDHRERNHQVSLMGDIYRSADQVAISTEVYFLASHSHCVPSEMSPYWSRAWIIQEFLLAKRIVFVGHVSVPSFEGLMDVLNQNGLPPKSSPMMKLLKRRKRLQGSGVAHSFLSLSDLLLDFEGAGCKEAHDVVYSLLGLIDWSQTPELPRLEVDYNLKKEDVAQRIIELTRCAGLAKDAKKVSDLIGYFKRVWDYMYEPGDEQEYQERLAALLEAGHGRRFQEDVTASSA